MLNCSNTKYQLLENQLVEVQTGEGKSIVLGVTATILALYDIEVDCICYSSFLSNRDCSAFNDLFAGFGVQDRIWYGTIVDLMGRRLGNSYRRQSEQFMRNTMRAETQRKESSLRVLLIDEVDVFFGEDVFGEGRNDVATFKSEKLSALFLKLWERRGTTSQTEPSLSHEFECAIKNFDVGCHDLLRNEFQNLSADAVRVGCGTETQYYVVDGKVAYKEFDGFTFGTAYRYETMFSYVKEWGKGTIPKSTMEKRLALRTVTGRVSYAEFPFEYEVILGVTGTLEGLGPDKRLLLESMYSIHKYAYIPSVYGRNNLRFEQDNSLDVRLNDREDNFFLDLKHEIIRRRRSRDGATADSRAVMVFFKNQKVLMDFYNSPVMEGMRNSTRIITETVAEAEKETMFLKATDSGAITLMIREYGRGTDFVCYDGKMLNDGGVHVIQAFFATDEAEEIQIKGRCARRGRDGSYSMVLNAVDITLDLGLTREEILSLQRAGKVYATLSAKRASLYRGRLETRQTKVHELETVHYQTLACRDAMHEGGKQRRNVLDFFSELNGLSSGVQTFWGNGLKSQVILERKHRLNMHCIADQKKRCQAQEVLKLTSSEAEMCKLRVRNALSSEGTHYDILGVASDASSDEVGKSYRQLSLLFHPDKCKDCDANEYFPSSE